MGSCSIRIFFGAFLILPLKVSAAFLRPTTFSYVTCCKSQSLLLLTWVFQLHITCKLYRRGHCCLSLLRHESNLGIWSLYTHFHTSTIFVIPFSFMFWTAIQGAAMFQVWNLFATPFTSSKSTAFVVSSKFVVAEHWIVFSWCSHDLSLDFNFFDRKKRLMSTRGAFSYQKILEHI